MYDLIRAGGYGVVKTFNRLICWNIEIKQEIVKNPERVG